MQRMVDPCLGHYDLIEHNHNTQLEISAMEELLALVIAETDRLKHQSLSLKLILREQS